jgi:hypothetical protein
MIDTIHLFPLLDQKLIELLKSLNPDDWNQPTVARLWTVKDVASHLLDGNLRTISMLRDGYSAPPDREIHSYADLVAFLNQLNADFVKASKRMSPALITELLEITGKQYSELLAAQDLDVDAIFAVSWAGEEVSKNWFHIAREFTEKWHHQQQIRDAVGKPGIITQELFYPFVETLLCGLPYTYRNTDAEIGTCIQISITLEGQMDWYLIKREDGWDIVKDFAGIQDATVILPADTAWKAFTKALSPAEAKESAILTGNQQLAEVSLNLIAVMA